MKKMKVVEVMPQASVPKNAMADADEPQDYEVKDAADTLMRAEDIKKNKKLMPHVHKHLDQKMKSLKSLKAMAGQKQNEEDAEADEKV